MDPIFEAIEFAAQAHAGQYRKGTHVPYIAHPLAVAKLLLENDFDSAVAIAGLLHDTVEDTRVTLEEIRARFGDRVAALVRAVTEPPRTFTWEERKRAMLQQLEQASFQVLALECADKLDNLREIQNNYARLGEATWERFNRPKEYQHWHYASMAQLFMRRVPEFETNLLFREYVYLVQAVFGALTPPPLSPIV